MNKQSMYSTTKLPLNNMPVFNLPTREAKIDMNSPWCHQMVLDKHVLSHTDENTENRDSLLRLLFNNVQEEFSEGAYFPLVSAEMTALSPRDRSGACESFSCFSSLPAHIQLCI